MERDFGIANFVLSVKRNASVLKCESRTNPGCFWLYKKNSCKRLANGTESIYFECLNCQKLGAERGRVTVQNNRILSDPEIGHNIVCAPSDKIDIESLQIKRQMLKNAENGEAPLRAYRTGLAQIPRQFHDPHLRDQIALAVPGFNSVRSSLYRASAKNLIPIPNIDQLPIEYELTLNGREARANNLNQDNPAHRFLLYNRNRLLIFASDVDLRVLHQSEFWVADGTFEMRPPIFSQIYTIHAFINGESFVCCYALMPDKTRAMYEILFGVISQAIFERHGDLGLVHTILLDFEAAAHNAARAVFNNVTTKGCLFHFGQCLIRQVQRNGLIQEYEDHESLFHRWIKLLKALALLPPDLIIQTYNAWLQDMPQVDDPIIQQRINNFKEYFRTNWLNGQWSIQIWNHFESEWRRNGLLGPRTTNHAEGWHNRINHDFGHPHPALNTFLHWLQQTGHVNNIRMQHLFNGEAPRQRRNEYVIVDANIRRAKNNFIQTRALIPVDGGFDALLIEIERYLRYIAHLLG